MNEKLVKFIVLFVVLIVVAGLIFPTISTVKGGPRTREKTDVTNLVTALKAFKVEYGDYPRGDHATILRLLRGDNPNKIIFIEMPEKSFNEKGEMIDSWGTAYRIDVDAPRSPHVSSAGKNKKFERLGDEDVKGSDDIISWQ